MNAPASFVFAKDTVTLLITLSTGVIGLYATFAKDLWHQQPPRIRRMLGIAWTVLAVSVAAGLVALMALTGTLATGSACPKPEVSSPPSSTEASSDQASREGRAGESVESGPRSDEIYCTNIKIPAFVQVFTFGVGMLLVGIALTRRDFSSPSSGPQDDTIPGAD